jgi:hypothetical protein
LDHTSQGPWKNNKTEMVLLMQTAFKSQNFQKILNGKMVACKMESNVQSLMFSTPSSFKVMSHDIYEHKIKIGGKKQKCAG